MAIAQLFWPLPDCRPSEESVFICWMKSSRQRLLIPFSAPFLLTLGPQLQGFESVGLVFCEEKSAPPTDEGNLPRHMLKKFNTIMANSHLRMASIWNDSFCVYANRAMNMPKTVVLFKGNVQRQLLCMVIWYEIIESKQGFFPSLLWWDFWNSFRA